MPSKIIHRKLISGKIIGWIGPLRDFVSNFSQYNNIHEKLGYLSLDTILSENPIISVSFATDTYKAYD